MADYILRADSPSNLQGGKVYYTEEGTWAQLKSKAKVYTAKTRATEAKNSTTMDCEIVAPDFETNQAVEDAV
jgi:hypothetical protein